MKKAILHPYIELEEILMDFETLETEHELVVTGTANIWDGERFVFKELDTTCVGESIQKAMNGSWEEAQIYVEGRELVIEIAHHDGTNKYLIREWKTEMTDRKYTNLYKKLDLNPEVEDRLETMKKYTKGIGEYVKNYYGW